jgi:hypothetical protein
MIGRLNSEPHRPHANLRSIVSTQPDPFDTLSSREREIADAMIAELANDGWAQPLIKMINEGGGPTATNKARLFELRFGHALHRVGIAPRYEIPGEAQSTLDFGFASANQPWAVELMRLEETQAARDATFTRVDETRTTWFGRHLYSSAEDPRQSIEGETLKAVQRICQKCENNGQPHKFPVPQGAYHAILVDMSSFLNVGGDEWDRIHIGLGGKYVPLGHRMHWNGKLVTGVFDADTNVRGARQAKERIHFIGFVNEPMRELGEFSGATQFVANPNLFPNSDAVRVAIATWPLQPTRVL